MTKKTNYSTIIIVDPKKGQSRSLSVPSRYVNKAKGYGILLVGLLGAIVTFGAMSYAGMEQSRKQQELLVSNISDLERQIPKPIDTINARNYVEQIEEKLLRINEYLKARGVSGFTHEAVGGEAPIAVKYSPNDYYSMYNQYLDQVVEAIFSTPIGLPAGSTLTSSYGYRSNPFHAGKGEFHAGLDFRGERGDGVRSTAGGVVIDAGWNGGYGMCVQIKHSNGYETWYGHLSKILVKKGETVSPGQTIGLVGSTGRSTGNHVHYEVRKNGKPVNPISFLKLD